MMDFNVDRQVKGYGRRSKRRRAWKRGLAALCCAVAVGTAWGLIRPALTAARDAYCGAEEHTHSVENGCYALVCGLAESDGHTHTEACYETQSVLVCVLEEGAAQTVATEKVLTCGMEESAGHTHGDDCYTGTTTLTCGQEESAGHTHTDECFDGEGNLVCGMEESVGHTHSDGCYTTETTLTCGQEESAGHTHTDDCYTEQTVVTEAAESAAPEPAAEETAPPHVHTDECYEMQEVLVCGMEESEPHEHTAECYGELICEKEEHTHTLPCFSDPNADLDTAEQWRAKAHAVALTGDYAVDLLAVAESQLGYTESTENYIVLDDGETVKGYTLYGAWYGDAYGDWCAMFVSFCLYYAEISDSDVPRAASCPRWVEALDDAGLYVSAGKYSPYEGDIVFFDWDGDGYADHVGLVYERAFADDGYTMTGITTIEGNSGNAVRENKYDADDSRILGYGALPVNPDNIAAVPAASNGILLAADNGVALAATEGDTPTAQDDGSIDFQKMITGVSMQYRENTWSAWQDLTSSTTVKESGQIAFTIHYTVPPYTLNTTHNTITYQLPENIILVEETRGNVTNNLGQPIGTYSITTDGKITITFGDDTVDDSAKGMSVYGKIYFEANVEDIQKNDTGDISIPFSDGVTVNLKVGEEGEQNPDLTVSKKAKYWDPDTGAITYEITVSSQSGTGNTVTLTDTMTNVEYTGGLTVTDMNGNAVSYGTAPANECKSFTLTLPKMSPGETYTIIYNAKFVDPGTYTNIDLKNNVKVASTDGSESPIEAETSCDIYVDHDVLGKTGTTNPDGTVTWTITVNQSHMDIGGWTLSDKLNGVDFKEEVEFTQISEDGATVKTFKANLPYIFDLNTTDEFIITYTTSGDRPFGTDHVTNEAILTDNKGQNVGDETGTGHWSGTYNPLNKKADSITESTDGKTATVHWTVTINATEGAIPADWTYYDNLWNGQYFTGTQLKALKENLDAALKSAGLNLSYEIKANKQQNADDIGDTVTWANIQDGEKYKTYTIIFHTTLEHGQSFTFSYETTAPVEGVTSSMYFQNSATINNKVGSSDGVTYRPSVPIISKVDNKNSGGGENTSHEIGDDAVKDGILEWLVKVTMPDNYSGGALTVVETLPEGVDLTYLEILADGVFGASNITTFGEHRLDSNRYNVVTATDGQKITINIPENLANASGLKEFRFVVRVKINDNFTWTDKTEDGVLKEGVFKNSVTLLDKEAKELNSDVQTQTVTKDEYRGVIDKSGSIKDNIASYSIVINPEGKTLLEGASYLTVEDVLSYYAVNGEELLHMTLVPGSVKVYYRNADGTKGDQLPAAACPYTYEATEQYGTDYRTLTIQVPDKTALIIEYQYLCKGKTSWRHDIINTAKIYGITTNGGSDQESIGVQVTQGGATADVDGVTICKVDKNNNAIMLSGAKFKLEIWDSSAEDYIPVTRDSTGHYVADPSGSDTTLETDEHGIFTIMLTYNTAYRLTEVEAPTNYKVDSTPYEFLIADTDTSAHPYCKPENHSVDALTSGAVLFRPNECTATSISVIKRWADENGNDVTDTATKDSISFELHQIATPEGGTTGTGGSGSLTGGDATFSMSIDRAERPNTPEDFVRTSWKTASGTYPAGTKVTIKVEDWYGDKDGYQSEPQLYLNGNLLSYTKTTSTEGREAWGHTWYAEYYTYEFTLTSGANNLIGTITGGNEEGDWIVNGPTFEVPETSGSGDNPGEGDSDAGGTATVSPDTVYGTYTISSTYGWNTTISSLPLEATIDGVTYHYSYYVEELNGNPTYLNNDTVNGIISGAITVTNTVSSDSPEVYTLPATGGRGTRGLALLGGTLTAAAGAVLLSRRKRKRKADD